MSFAKLFGLGIAVVLITTLWIIFCQRFLDLGGWQDYLVWFSVFLINLNGVRRLGHINFLEAILVLFIWLLFRILLDIILIPPTLGFSVYGGSLLWISYLVMALTIFFGHKKRHILVRQELHKHHHGHH